MNQPVLHKIRKGSLIWVNVTSQSPQLYSTSTRGFFEKLIGMHSFPPTADGKYSGITLPRIAYREEEGGELKEGYLEEITDY